MQNKKIKLKTKQVISVLLMLIIVLSTTTITSFATTKTKVKIGCFPLNGFYNISDDGNVTGYGAEYTDTVATHAGWDYEFVIYPSWVEAINALDKNEIDILAPAQRTAEREAKYAFDSFPIGTEYGALLTLSTNDKLIYEDYSTFNNLSVGCVKSLVFLDDFNQYQKQNNFSVNFKYYKDTPAVIAAMNAGDVDAMLVNMMVKTDAMKLLARFDASPYYYMLSKKATNLREELNLSVDEVSSEHPEYQNTLSSEFFSEFDRLPFSKSELDFISSVKSINVACGGNFAPFSYIDSETGKIDGVDYAMLEKISKYSGLKFNYYPLDFEKDTNTLIKENKISLIAGVENDGLTQLHGSSFTDSYLTIQKYFIGLEDSVIDNDTKSVIGIISAEAAQIQELKETYPNFTFKRYSSAEECIDAVKKGDIQFFLNDRNSSEKLLSNPRNSKFKLFPTQAYESKICFKDLLEGEDSELLTSILNKSIKQISQSDKEALINDYTQINGYEYTAVDFLYQYRIQISSVGVILIILIIAMAFVLRAKKKSRLNIKQNEMKLRNITNNIRGGVIVLKADKGLEITYANDGFLELIGCSRNEFKNEANESYLAYVHEDDLDKVKDAINSEENEISMELRVLNSNGEYIPALFNCTSGEKIDGEKELYCVIMDMTEQNNLLEQLRIDNRRTELILDRVDEIFYEVNLMEHSISTSNSFIKKLGWDLPKHIEMEQENEFKNMWSATDEGKEQLLADTKKMIETKDHVSSVVQINNKNKEKFIWCEVSQYPIMTKGNKIASVIGLIKDIDKQVIEREKLIEQAQRDRLTGLYNKEVFESLVCEHLKKLPNQNHALIFIDLDHFKSLNDTLGHLMGDKAICEAADKLKIIFSNYDIISRFGGDEFCIFVKNIPIETLRGKMEWLIDKMHNHYTGAKGSVDITCSCGIACTDAFGFDYKTLMNKADKALYYSKETGRDRFTFCRDIPQDDE